MKKNRGKKRGSNKEIIEERKQANERKMNEESNRALIGSRKKIWNDKETI